MPLLSRLVPDDFVPSDHLPQNALHWLAGALVASPFFYYGLMAIYNIYFHPLSKYPGPKSWIATPFPYVMLQLRGVAPTETAKLHNKYGPIVRISANELSVTYPGAWRDIYGHRKPGQAEMTKDKRFFAALKEPDLIHSDREYHAYLRKLMSNGFSDSALRQQEALVQQYLNTLMSRLHKKGGEGSVALDLTQWFSYFTFDVIGYLTYGESFNCLKDSYFDVFLDNTLGFVMFMAIAQAAARLPSWMRLPLFFLKTPKDIKQKVATSEQILEAKVKNRLENQPPVPDFMGKLIDVYHKKEMTFGQLKQNSRLILFAGSETTATALAGITKLLLEHPEQYNKLATEIRTRFKSTDEITMTSVNTCRYLLAVIEEGLRVYPPSPTAHPRYVPPGGVTLDNGKHFVPEDMLVGITTYAILHSQDNWVNPEKFAPERWFPEKGSHLLEGEDEPERYTRPDEYNADKKDSFQAFSFGPRNCIGRNLAYAEMKLVLARMMFEFDWEWCGPENDNWFDQRVFMIWRKKPLSIKLHPRQKAA